MLLGIKENPKLIEDLLILFITLVSYHTNNNKEYLIADAVQNFNMN